MKPHFEPHTHYSFSRDKVLTVDVREFLELYDPSRLTPFQMRVLFGSLSLEVEGAAAIGDLATIPEGRQLIRHLHAAWPWVGYFLDLDRPFGSAQTLGAMPMLAYAICLVDMHLTAWDRIGKCFLHVDEEQLYQFCMQAFYAIDGLGSRALIPSEVLLGRKRAVLRQINRAAPSVEGQ